MNAFLSMLLIVDDVKKGLQRCIFSPLIPFFNHLFQLKKAIKGMKFLVQHGIVQKCTRMFSLLFLFRYHFVIQPSWIQCSLQLAVALPFIQPSVNQPSIRLAFCQPSIIQPSVQVVIYIVILLYGQSSVQLALYVRILLFIQPSIQLD